MDTATAHLRAHDPVMASLIDSYTISLPEKHTNYYHELVSSIISQQLSVKAAHTIEGRFKQLFADEFPSPEQLLDTDIATLRSVGLSRPKANYIHDLAERILSGDVSFHQIDAMTNEEIITMLTKIKGIGVWTAHMFLLFCMARLDVLPTGDLGIQNAITKLYMPDQKVTPADVELIAATHDWQPYASIASLYLWKSLDNTPK